MRQAGEVKWPRNAACFCGSGKKYKRCCYAQAVRLVRDADGAVQRQIPIDPAYAEELRRVKAARESELGRPLRPDDRLFPVDPSELESAIVGAMVKAKTPPVMIYAHLKTQVILTDQNRAIMRAEDVEAWDQACVDYQEAVERGENPFAGMHVAGVVLPNPVG